ncbi:uncharacterized protein A1O5_01772 [Cladophialophora psammophila CBS 110553]|uniref:Fumarylacetoacetase-like C-terminal domain-containing protein n=1 Tax=Cladophialophora psammophila CBS 110553 TaxID=1182543 RepID=W9XDN7_9EURO|nr:uncharacterized protein A1O5_01772 [Cladophialophora psammophila CBS 110553]EXJ75076.1 hypothetical protein A1O5_01772 [Cladophialophora psammophila CBS 110553]
MKVPFQRLVRFEDPDGNILFGEAPAGDNLVGQQVAIYEGDKPWSLRESPSHAKVAKVICPLPASPLVYGVGLNYSKHIAECGYPTPEYPTSFIKPPDALVGPYSDIRVSKSHPQIDYEGEFTFVVGKDAKAIESKHAADYILGYTVGNDVTSRQWQRVPGIGTNYGKSADGFAPIGPILVATDVVDPDQLELITRVNGKERQRSGLDDLRFKAGDILAHLSRYNTIREGTVIMTGTPAGVGAFMDPPVWLKQDDVVEVEISSIGTIKNRFLFA